MGYCMRIWNEWRECRKEPSDITKMTKMEMDEALCLFVLEMQEKNPESSTLQILCRHICCGIMHYLRAEGRPNIGIPLSAISEMFSTLK